MADPNIFDRLGFGGGGGANQDPFGFLEGVLTPDALRSMQRTRQESARRMSQSMGTHERAGFGFGRILGHGIQSLLPNSRQNQEKQEAQINAAVLEETAAEIGEGDFSGPLGGLNQDLATLELMSEKFQEAGNPEAAARAQQGAAQVRQQIEHERLRQRQANLNIEMMEANSRATNLANRERERRSVTDRYVWPVSVNEAGEMEIGEGLDTGTRAGELRAGAYQSEGTHVLRYEDMVGLLGRQGAQERVQRAYTASDVATKRTSLEFADELYRSGASLMNLMETAPIDPQLGAAGAANFVNRVMQEMGAFQDVATMMRRTELEGRSQEIDANYETARNKLELEEIAEVRSLARGQVERLAYVFARLWGGSRPSDADFERAMRVLVGDSGQRSIVIQQLDQELRNAAGTNVTQADLFMEGSPDDPGVRALSPLRTRVSESIGQYEAATDSARRAFPSARERIQERQDAPSEGFGPGGRFR